MYVYSCLEVDSEKRCEPQIQQDYCNKSICKEYGGGYCYYVEDEDDVRACKCHSSVKKSE